MSYCHMDNVFRTTLDTKNLSIMSKPKKRIKRNVLSENKVENKYKEEKLAIHKLSHIYFTFFNLISSSLF